ncbi:MAG: SMI1/KNR4 family protein [Cocleimonas sp.]|nr:SMI1/KNR4 family protein [Cocleimonas sp.]
MKNIDLEKTYNFNWGKLTKDEKSVFEAFPKDYQDFLKENNGGMVVDEEKCFFKTDLVRKFDDGRIYEGSSNGVEEFLGFLSYENEEPGEDFEYPMSILHQHYDRHLEEEFLPSNVIVIGRCVQNCLIAISLNKHDFGSVYYWEWYWQYPWFEEYFQTRIKQASKQFEDVGKILENPDHPKYQKAFDALNYATWVKVAPTFTDFIDGLYETNNEDD